MRIGHGVPEDRLDHRYPFVRQIDVEPVGSVIKFESHCDAGVDYSVCKFCLMRGAGIAACVLLGIEALHNNS